MTVLISKCPEIQMREFPSEPNGCELTETKRGTEPGGDRRRVFNLGSKIGNRAVAVCFDSDQSA